MGEKNETLPFNHSSALSGIYRNIVFSVVRQRFRKSKCCSTECDGHATGETLRLFLENKKQNKNKTQNI
jgi:hypothetical protein